MRALVLGAYGAVKVGHGVGGEPDRCFARNADRHSWIAFGREDSGRDLHDTAGIE